MIMLASRDAVPQGKGTDTIPIIGSAVLIFLVAVGLAYVNSATGKSDQYQTAAAQAEYLARQGIQERGLTYLRSLTPEQLPTSRVNLPSGKVAGIGEYREVSIVPTSEISGNGSRPSDMTYRISATGVVKFKNETGESIEITDSRNELYWSISFARFHYITNYEVTIFGEVIKFFHLDTLYGRVHSNDQIAIMERPVFYGLVTTCAEDFWHGPGYNPYFAIPPQFNVPPVPFPDSLNALRRCAAQQGLTFDGEGVYQFRLVFYPDGVWYVWRWHLGTIFDDTIRAMGDILESAFFFDGPLELKGRLYGIATVGSSEDIRLIDDIWYASSQNGTGQIDTNSYHDMLGIVAEGNIVIGNTPENGRDNRTMGGTDIIINAAMLALGESFTFEDQNDIWNLYQGPYPDERGVIHFWGSLAQYRRGYVHRSNHNGTGYGRAYRNDPRFDRRSPPCFPMITNANGNCLYDIVPPGGE
jgi:hypothetical protein